VKVGAVGDTTYADIVTQVPTALPHIFPMDLIAVWFAVQRRVAPAVHWVRLLLLFPTDSVFTLK
jgi:hypothetical protein